MMLLTSLNYALSLGFGVTFLLAGLVAAALLHTFRNLAGHRDHAARRRRDVRRRPHRRSRCRARAAARTRARDRRSRARRQRGASSTSPPDAALTGDARASPRRGAAASRSAA